MCLEVLSSSSPSFLLEKLLIPESTGLLLDDSVNDVTVTEGEACIQVGPGADAAAESSCEFKKFESDMKTFHQQVESLKHKLTSLCD